MTEIPVGDASLTTRVALVESRVKTVEERQAASEEKIETVGKVSVPLAVLGERVALLQKLVITELLSILVLAWTILRAGIIK